eukprot:Platyproteum_vivax@DN4825_c0_g1_i1.p1
MSHEYHVKTHQFRGWNGAIAQEFQDLFLLAAQHYRRFPEEVPDQNLWQKVSRYLIPHEMRFNALPFKCEKEFEDWVDHAATVVKKYSIDLPLFLELWEKECGINIFPPDYKFADYEEVTDYIATIIFRNYLYVREVEDSLLFGLEHDSVFGAKAWLAKQACLYLRLCRRHKRKLCVSNNRLMETAVSCLPLWIVNEMGGNAWAWPIPNQLTNVHQVFDIAREKELNDIYTLGRLKQLQQQVFHLDDEGLTPLEDSTHNALPTDLRKHVAIAEQVPMAHLQNHL